MTFANRTDAGRHLAERLAALLPHPIAESTERLVVLGLPRGGVPVAAPVAIALGAPLDVLPVRKLGLPWQPELAMGAVAEGGITVIEDAVATRAGISDEELLAAAERELPALEHVAGYREGRPPVPLEGCTAVIVDDGLATGATARAACLAARDRGASHVVLAVPVAPPHWALPLHDVADECVALHVPHEFHAVGQAYQDFAPTTDDEVAAALAEANAELTT